VYVFKGLGQLQWISEATNNTWISAGCSFLSCESVSIFSPHVGLRGRLRLASLSVSIASTHPKTTKELSIFSPSSNSTPHSLIKD